MFVDFYRPLAALNALSKPPKAWEKYQKKQGGFFSIIFTFFTRDVFLQDKVGVKTQTKRKRPKPVMIQFAEECAPLVLISKASLDTGLTERQIRDSGIKLRRIGTADYIRPTELNTWILNGPSEENASWLPPISAVDTHATPP